MNLLYLSHLIYDDKKYIRPTTCLCPHLQEDGLRRCGGPIFWLAIGYFSLINYVLLIAFIHTFFILYKILMLSLFLLWRSLLCIVYVYIKIIDESLSSSN